MDRRTPVLPGENKVHQTPTIGLAARPAGAAPEAGLMDAKGHPYRGVAYYRLKVDVPARAAGRSVWLLAPAAVNEVWVWVNGKYAGHRPYTSPWSRPHEVEVDISRMIEPGETNQITLRVLCNYDVFGANGIYERMFIYAKTKPGAS